MGALAISPAEQAAVLVSTSTKYGIPLQALLGIYGQETSFGQNVSTSSAAAAGPFQFIPSTAAQWNYPYTNTPTLAQFQQQADAWGKFLVAGNPSKSASGWAPAMGGGYSEAQAESTISSMPAALKAALGPAALNQATSGGAVQSGAAAVGSAASSAAGAIGSALNPLGDVAAVLSAIWDFLTTPAKWLRVLEFIAGTVLVYMALHSMTGAGPGASTVVEAAAAA